MKDKFLKHLTGVCPLQSSALPAPLCPESLWLSSSVFQVLFISVRSAASTFTDFTTTRETAPSPHTIKDVPGYLLGWRSVPCAWRDKLQRSDTPGTLKSALETNRTEPSSCPLPVDRDLFLHSSIIPLHFLCCWQFTNMHSVNQCICQWDLPLLWL